MRVVALTTVLFACGTTYTDPPPVSTSAGTGLTQWVSPFIGTTAGNSSSPVPDGAGGSTFPGAALPFGMVQWGPDTPNAQPPGYEWTDSQIVGFSVTHLNGAGCNGLRDFPVFPISGDWDPSNDATDTFSHDHEIASPGFYEVVLGSGIQVDLTATARTGLARFSFPHERKGTLLVGGSRTRESLLVSDAALALRDDGVIVGHRKSAMFCGTPTGYTVHFAARFDRAFSDMGSYDIDGAVAGSKQSSGTGSGLYFDFDTSQNGAVHMKIGLSYTSDDAALANLDAESPGWDFDATHAAAQGAWNAALGHVAVEGGTDDDRRAFYTALYHVLLQPAVASDVDGSFMGFDDQVHVAKDYVRHQNFSGWDVYRSWIQLVAAIAPDHASDIARSVVDSGSECGAMPKWSLANREASTMVGDPAPPFIANAYAFGARGFDAQKALALMTTAATDPNAACQGHPLRPGLADCLAKGYCPFDAPGAPEATASTTLEYDAADFAIARFATALGDDATRATFTTRAAAWKNLFDATLSQNGFTGYVQPRDLAGTFHETDVTTQNPSDFTGTSGFIEGNATQYTLAVHDVPGLIALLGSDAALVSRLDAFFTQVNAGLQQPYFYVGNEPGFATPWAYAFAGAPAKTSDVLHRALHDAFTTQPGGLPGNDDLGAMSAWQAWAMLGMYPAIPGVSGVVLTTPVFSKATLTLAGGAQLVIATTGTGPYIDSVTIDGTPSTSSWLDWSKVATGANLSLTLATTPSATWGVAPGDRPPTF